MKYKVVFTNKADKALKRIDHSQRKIILSWLKTNLVNCEEPRKQGKALSGEKKGYWRYRVGVYRIIAKIDDTRLIIIMINISRRKDVYEF
ncbi:MAG: type II toxin-antitoxin system RelE family toxin [Natronincolaceae bacterium]|jgi:mRNA interferase RelE/StbE|nr:type II toxin-antitoxin system RelE/ParE family toxin [Bacillota bacterium]NLK90584.1 type II toxin-antitoxin system RelE/ParE family toxin [Clostridiales bacterium]